MIRQVDKSHYNIPIPGNPMLHRELAWYATDDDAVIGVVILDLAYKDYSWAVLTPSDQAAGYTTADMGQSLPTEEDATAASGLKAWHCFAFLVVAATIWYAAKRPLIVVGMVAGSFWSLNWLCHRFLGLS